MAHMRLLKVSNGKVIGQDRELGARGEGVRVATAGARDG